MKYFRNVSKKELFQVLKTNKVTPKKFKTNEDSTTPSGNWSFWFNVPAITQGSYAVIVADFSPEKEGTMFWDWNDKDFGNEFFQIPEFVTSKEVTPIKIFVDTIYKKEFPQLPTFSTIDDNQEYEWECLHCLSKDRDWNKHPYQHNKERS